jgi:hypothetical protein
MPRLMTQMMPGGGRGALCQGGGRRRRRGHAAGRVLDYALFCVWHIFYCENMAASPKKDKKSGRYFFKSEFFLLIN